MLVTPGLLKFHPEKRRKAAGFFEFMRVSF
jgi:hypothetical protein